MSVPEPPPMPPTAPMATDVTQDEKTMAMLAYLLGIITGFIGPLIIWLIKKDQSRFVAYHGLQALILHGVVVIGYIISSFLMVVLIGLLTYPLFGLLGLVFSIMAAMAANRGEWYSMPVVGKFVRQQMNM